MITSMLRRAQLTGACAATAVPDVPVGTNSGAPSVTVKSSSSLQIDWNADPTGFPENLADRYEIQRSATSQSGPFTTIASNVNPADLLYVDTGLSASTKYWYELRAVNCFGASAYTTTDISATTQANTVAVEYLVVAGGGGGTNDGGGGGGAGGYRTATGFALTPGTSYTITVGAGGGNDTKGSNSVFSTITSEGGGRGRQTGTGGSGGGARTQEGAGAAGTSGQGNNGGSSTSGIIAGGGGGGASAVGANAGAGSTGGDGGAGSASSITGTSVTRGGGGGGCRYFTGGSAGAGGAGGGGAGGVGAVGTAGSVNTGGGGGGGGQGSNGGSGGSGIVIIRMATRSGVTTTGSPSITTVGGDTVYEFTASGTITV